MELEWCDECEDFTDHETKEHFDFVPSDNWPEAYDLENNR